MNGNSPEKKKTKLENETSIEPTAHSVDIWRYEPTVG